MEEEAVGLGDREAVKKVDSFCCLDDKTECCRGNRNIGNC
jgi:hypothetical protein